MKSSLHVSSAGRTLAAIICETLVIRSRCVWDIPNPVHEKYLYQK